MSWIESGKTYVISVPAHRRADLLAAFLGTGERELGVELLGLPGCVFPSGPPDDRMQSGRVVVKARMFEEARAVEFDYRFTSDDLEIVNLQVWGYADCDTVARQIEDLVSEALE